MNVPSGWLASQAKRSLSRCNRAVQPGCSRYCSVSAAMATGVRLAKPPTSPRRGPFVACAHRSRSGGIGNRLQCRRQVCHTGGAACWSQGYGASSCLATCIFCGCSSSLVQRDRDGLPMADRDRAEPDQQPHQRLMCRAGKTRDQLARKLRFRHRRHKPRARRPPGRRQLSCRGVRGNCRQPAALACG